MKIAMAQINTIVGDFDNILEKCTKILKRAQDENAELLVFPELTFSGYPPKDLIEKHGYAEKSIETLNQFAKEVQHVGVVCGFISINDSEWGKPYYNSAAFIQNGKIEYVVNKCLLPTYDVFDETRYFEPARGCGEVIEFNGFHIGLTICEDLWNDPDIFTHRTYPYDPVNELYQKGTDLLINISASPFTKDKPATREKISRHAAMKYSSSVIMVNQVGGFDDIIFDGNSIAFDRKGNLIARCKDFDEDFIVVEIDKGYGIIRENSSSTEEALYKALVMGTRDYTRKCGFSKVVIGLSGGIDSSLVACIAVEALGAENVLGVAMPSMFSSESSVRDAKKIAENLGIEFITVPITNIYNAFVKELKPIFKNLPFDNTEENLQARIRGNILMALSNKFGSMVLSTGNKSELAVGYSTLYGDMCGGLAVISDLLKTTVYDIARWINRDKETIPEAIIKKAPSAELRPGQTDQDDLPPYEILDKVLKLYIEEQFSVPEIVTQGFDMNMVKKIVKMVDRNEYKRRQAPPGLKVTGKAFGYGRRLPIVQRFNGDI